MTDENGDFIFYQEIKNGQPNIETITGNSGNKIKVIYGYLLTDDGKFKINAFYKLEREYSSQDNYDCHGLTFTDGTFWINNSEVDKILKGDNYELVDNPQKGDVLIQRDENGNVIHSATVLSYDNKNNSVKVKEALGVFQEEDENGKKYNQRYYNYSIDSSRDSFYRKTQLGD